MAGNVLDWCDAPGESYRVLRGGGWGYGVDYCRAAVRSWYLPVNRNNDVGCRLLVSSRQNLR